VMVPGCATTGFRLGTVPVSIPVPVPVPVLVPVPVPVPRLVASGLGDRRPAKLPMNDDARFNIMAVCGHSKVSSSLIVTFKSFLS
jgi:hypothetical protein